MEYQRWDTTVGTSWVVHPCGGTPEAGQQKWDIKGKPLIMDKMTTRMCNEGVGRLGFATVLIVVNANKELKDRIEMCYKDKNNVTKGSKFVNVEYGWRPPMCAKVVVKTDLAYQLDFYTQTRYAVLG
nr:hypothetical protein [Tanacetum cinerariifolium]